MAKPLTAEVLRARAEVCDAAATHLQTRYWKPGSLEAAEGKRMAAKLVDDAQKLRRRARIEEQLPALTTPRK